MLAAIDRLTFGASRPLAPTLALAWPAELQYPYPAPPEWIGLKAHSEHPAVDWIREMYRRHRGVSQERTAAAAG